MNLRILTLLVLLVCCPGLRAAEKSDYVPMAGLPPHGASEDRLFAWNPSTSSFFEVDPADVKADNLYVRWYNHVGYYVWCLGRDRRMIVNGSKVHGARIGMRGQSAKNWFRLKGGNHNEWAWVTDRQWPKIWVWTPESGKVVAEVYPAGWEKTGGVLDPVPSPQPPPQPEPEPLPPPKPEPQPQPQPQPPPQPEPQPQPQPPPQPSGLGCQITVSPPQVKLGGSVILTMTTSGEVTEATLDGAVVDFPTVRRMKEATVLGTIPVVGTVRGLRGATAECRSQFHVVATEEQLSISTRLR